MLDDTDAASADTEDSGNDAGTETTRRASPDRSTIAFPYTHLEDAVSVARALYNSGVAISRDQVAGILGLPPTSGGFSLKINSARMFGLIELSDGKYQLSQLGERILSSDDSEARNARREAFLKVELYQKTFETYRGRILPARPTGLENAFESFGVAPKQKDKARLAFERSAQFAGFFHAGKERLVEPIIAGSPAPNGRQPSEPPVAPAKTEPPIREELPGAAQQLLIRGLLERMPAPATGWPLTERARWLRALAVNLAMIYGENDDGEISIQVPTKPVAAPAAPAASTKATAQAAPKPQAAALPDPTSGSGDLDDEIPF